MNTDIITNFSSDDSESDNSENLSQSDFESSDETSSNILLLAKKRKIVLTKSSSEEESNDNPEDDWIDIESVNDDVPSSKIPYRNTNPQNIENLLDPINYFKKFMTDELINKIITQTNAYANEQIANKKLSSRSVWRNWKNITYEEMLAFFGLILNMDTIYLTDIKDYFSKDFTRNIPFFSKIFKRERFFQIFWMLQLHQNENNENNDSNPLTRFSKVKNLLDYIDLQFRQNFVPGQEICVDEVVVPFKGKFSYLTEFKEPTKIRIYVLLDLNAGYVYSILPYFGSVASKPLIHPELPDSARIVLQLYNNLLKSIPNSEGHHLYVNKYFSSDQLAEELLKLKCYLKGTIKTERKTLQKQIRIKSMYCFSRKSLKVWRKVFFWVIELCSLNSYILYREDCKYINRKPMSYKKFIGKLVMSLIRNHREGETPQYGTPSMNDIEERLDGKLHILQIDPRGKHNDCLVCSNRKVPGGRKTTVYFCETCNRKPFLHIGDCFKKYHTLKTYK